MKLEYPASGGLPVGTPISWQRKDQGQDLVIPWGAVWQAPGDFECVNVASNATWPDGFGPRYAWVRYTSGPYAKKDANGNWVIYYYGHCTSLVEPGQRGSFGHPIARADQGHPSSIGITPPWPPGDGGWTEFGQVNDWPNNPWLGPNNPNGHWFDYLLRGTLTVTVPDPTLKWGDSGWSIIGLTNMLKQMGYLQKIYRAYNDPAIHGAVVAFKTKHHIPMPPAPNTERGWVDQRTNIAMQHIRDICVKTHTKDYP